MVHCRCCHCYDVLAFSCGCYRSFLLSVGLVGKQFIFSPCLKVRGLSSRLSDVIIKIPVCASRVVPFDIIIALEIVWPPDLANYIPFSNCLISWDRCSVGLYCPIILTASSSRSILLIAPYLENRCCIMVSADTCPKPVS